MFEPCYMPHISIIINSKSCITTEIVHKQEVNNIQKLILAYINNVQHVPAGDH